MLVLETVRTGTSFLTSPAFLFRGVRAPGFGFEAGASFLVVTVLQHSEHVTVWWVWETYPDQSGPHTRSWAHSGRYLTLRPDSSQLHWLAVLEKSNCILAQGELSVTRLQGLVTKVKVCVSVQSV